MISQYVTSAELAKLLKVSGRTIIRWRDEGTGPKYIKLNGSVRYNINDVEAWLICQADLSGS